MVTKEQLMDYLLIQRKTILETAEILGVHRNTITKWVKHYEIDTSKWWYFKPIYCSKCNTEIDPERQYLERKRKNLHKKANLLCHECDKDNRRARNREKAARYREKNRDYYNFYMREYLKKKKSGESNGD